MSRRPRQRKTIFFVIGTLDVGGTERHLTDVARALVTRGWDVSVYCVAKAGPLQGILEEGGVRVFLPPTERFANWPHLTLRLLNKFWQASAAFDLWRVLISRRPSIVHFFLPGAYILGAPAAIAALRPIRIMSRRSLNFYQRKSSLLKAIELRLHRRMTAGLGNSQRVVRELVDEGFPKGRVGVIYNGIDLARFEGATDRIVTRERLDIAPGALVLTIVANLIPYKGHADLIDALALAQPGLPADWRLLVVGRDDGIGRDLQERAARLGIQRSIQFLGLRPDVPDILKASDIGILCSHEEGFSNALLEGMAAGLPMIATDVGGNAEALGDGDSGILVPAQDVPSLANAIVRLAKDEELRRALGDAAHERVKERFTLDRCVEHYDRFYRGLLAGARVSEIESLRVDGPEKKVEGAQA